MDTIASSLAVRAQIKLRNLGGRGVCLSNRSVQVKCTHPIAKLDFLNYRVKIRACRGGVVVGLEPRAAKDVGGNASG